MSKPNDKTVARDVATYIGKMERIDGWLSAADAECFVHVDAVQKEKGVRGDLVEIGVWHGRGAILLHHLARPEEKVLAVDMFDLREREHPFFNDPERLKENAAEFGCDERLVPVRMDTPAEGHRLPDLVGRRGARIIHIDGGHDYATVRRDIEIASRLLRGGAVLVFDDFFSIGHPGTTQAIMEFMVTTPGYAPFLITKKKLWVCQADWYKRYFGKFKEVGVAKRRAEMFHHRVLIAESV